MDRLAIAITALTFTTLSFSCGSGDKSNSGTAENTEEVNQLPAMIGTKLDGSTVNIKQLHEKVVLILFQPDCDHCQREAVQIHDHLDAFADYSIYFITTDSLPVIEKFAIDYHLKNASHVHFIQTPVQSILTNFGNIDAPSLYIYSKEQKLVKKFNGETPIEKIISSLEP
jgi:thiol-disulfide isomerase/thioredoxin